MRVMRYMMVVMLMTATTPLLASTVNLGTLTPFTGGDAGEGFHEADGFTNALHHGLVFTGARGVFHESKVPEFRVVQVRKPTTDE